jgi:hypothetical protein
LYPRHRAKGRAAISKRGRRKQDGAGNDRTGNDSDESLDDPSRRDFLKTAKLATVELCQIRA